jgi:hypothetical protein
MPSQTIVASFVLRFVKETSQATADSPQTDWHGIIKHVQSDSEQRFTHLADAIAFIAQFVELDEFSQTIDSIT